MDKEKPNNEERETMHRQLSFADIAIEENRKPSRILKKLERINELVDWNKILEIVKVVDRTDKLKGGAPHRDILVKIKMLFLQYLYNLSDPELEDQVNDRISFQRFVGLDLSQSVPDYTTIWRFKERLIEEGLMNKIFALIQQQIEEKHLLVKKGTIVDATIIESSNRPMSKLKREKSKGSSQIDTDAHSTAKGGKKYYGYKGHIGVDVGSKLIRKRAFSSAEVHDSRLIEELIVGDEEAIFADSAYGSKERKKRYRKEGIYYGILDRATRSKSITEKQKKKNKKKSRVRSAVEHVFAYMKQKQNYIEARAKNYQRNKFAFEMNCVIYNIMRASYLIERRGALVG